VWRPEDGAKAMQSTATVGDEVNCKFKAMQSTATVGLHAIAIKYLE